MCPYLRSAALVAVIAASASCFDPVHSDAVSSQGPEKDGVQPGPLHRAGQMCLACHGGQGPGSPEMSVAGTIYATRTGTEPLVGATVTLQDAAGSKRTLTTNAVGNFYVLKSDWAPAYPLFVRLDAGGNKKIMQTRIGGQGSCAFCHNGARPNGDAVRMPPVFFEDR
jgi:cytochrome c553